jgi:hypothetical protein
VQWNFQERLEQLTGAVVVCNLISSRTVFEAAVRVPRTLTVLPQAVFA